MIAVIDRIKKYNCNCITRFQKYDTIINSTELQIIRPHTLPLIHQWRLLICIAFANGSNNTVGRCCCSAHQDVSTLQNTTLIWSVMLIANAKLELVYRRTLLNRLKVSLYDSKFPNRVLGWMTPKSISINWVTT